MSPRRAGWDFAQIRSSFLSDPEFQRLRGACRNDRDFLASIGLWAIANAQAWREDSDVATGVLASYPGFAKGPDYLRGADLIRQDNRLAGFAKWTEAVRHVREADAERKRGVPPIPVDSGGNNGTPVEFSRGVNRGKGLTRGELEENGGEGTRETPPDLRCEPSLDAYSRFYPSPTRDALRFLDELAEEFGQEWTARAIGEAGQGGRGKLLSRAKTLLILWARQADKDEEATERERVAAKRAPLKREPKPDETPEERAKAEAAFASMKSAVAGLGLPGTRP